MAYDRKTEETKKKHHDFSRRCREASEPDEGTVIGRNAVRELYAGGRSIDKIFVARGEREGSIGALVAEAIERRIPLIEVDRRKLDDLACGQNHQGIVAMASQREYCEIGDILAYADERGEKPLILVADGIEDPHNLGAMIRSAECAGAHGVIIPKRRSVGMTATVSKASAGAVEHMRVARVTNIAATLDELKQKGLWIYAADMDGEAYYETDFSSGVALVVGSEGFGISRLVKEKCDFIVSIPLYGKVNSLNASAATAVILCEIGRQRHC